MKTVLLLAISNVFMTFAWYGHLKFTNRPLWIVVVFSWLIAFAEYCFQVPANRMGQMLYGFSAPQLKIMQEAITLAIFAAFSFLYLHQPLRWNHWVAFAFLFGAVFFSFYVNAPTPIAK